MTILLSNTKSQFETVMADSDQVVQLTVTGVDVKGQMFRHSATVLMLDGRDCAFLSKSQPELESSILAEFNYPQAEMKRRISQGRVQSSQVEGENSSLYKVVVELEVAQTEKVTPSPIKSQAAVKKPELSLLLDSRAEGKGDPIKAPLEFTLSQESKGIPQTLPKLSNEDFPSLMVEGPELLIKNQVENARAIDAAVKAAVATEIKQQINLLKSWLSSELEKGVPAIVSPQMEKMIGNAVEKQISVNYQSSIQALNMDVARQVGDRIVDSEELRTALENMAKKLFEEQSVRSLAAWTQADQELTSRGAMTLRSFEESIAKVEARINAVPVQAEQELASRGATILQSFEESIAKVEARISAVRADMKAVLTMAQTLKQEAIHDMLPIQKALEQLSDIEKDGIEKFQKQAALQLNTAAAQFENQLNNISAERAVLFAMDIEKHLAPHSQHADETVEKLGAILQLVQGTARIQQERITEHSKTTAANFEKEIRALLLRLAAGG